MGDPKDSDHLYCAPRAESTLAVDYKRLDYYVSREHHLPVRIVAVDASENKVTRADFPDLSPKTLNVDLPDSALRLPKETDSYHPTEEPLEPQTRGDRSQGDSPQGDPARGTP
jgi:hypothetical protein